MIKKAFFDYWDNFFHFSIINLVFVFSLFIFFRLSFWLLDISTVLSLIVFISAFVWMGILTSASALYINEITQGRRLEMKQFFHFLKEGWLSGLIYVVLWGAVAAITWFVVPFYSNLMTQENMEIIGFTVLAFLFWAFLLFLLSMQFYFPTRAQLNKEFRKIMKKIFILFFDNVLYAIGLFILSIVIFVLSGFTAFLLFGPAAIILLGQTGLKLRLYKYDYFEENPITYRRKIPWKLLIYEDSQKIGKRTLKGMIFPWKE